MTSESVTPELAPSGVELSSHTVMYRPQWVPVAGIRPTQVGVCFGAIRVMGDRGVEIGEALMRETKGRAGAILNRVADEQRTYFLVPAHTEFLRWPPGVVDLSRASHPEYLPIPALTGETHPYSWWSPPRSPETMFSDHEMLRRVVCDLLNWQVPA
jgi:hypothetical protein